MFIERSELALSSTHRLEQEHHVKTSMVSGLMDEEGILSGPATIRGSEFSFKGFLEEEMMVHAAGENGAPSLAAGGFLPGVGGDLLSAEEQPVEVGESLEQLFNSLKNLMTHYLLRILERSNGDSPVGENAAVDVEDLINSSNLADAAIEDAAAESALNGPRPRMRFDFHHQIFEEEETTFSAQGQVNTADGRTIDLSYDLSMSRREMREVQASMVMDPLVIQYSGAAAELEESMMDFDLNSDGEMESISRLGPGCAWLAYDQNEDGLINDGSELFGAGSGDGFGELAAHDDDANGWIDEADSIYDRLSLWTTNEVGEDELISVREAGLGAFSLSHADTEYRLIQDETTLGHITASGIGLREDGVPFSIQQIDLALG